MDNHPVSRTGHCPCTTTTGSYTPNGVDRLMPRADTTPEAPQQTAHMVVVGHFTGLTDTHVQVTFPAMSGDRTLTVKRTDLRASGSTGVAVPGSNARAVSFACAVCPTCNNEPAERRSVSFSTDDEGNEVRTVTKCATCNGKGHVSDFGTDTPVIDPDHADIVDHLTNGNLPPGAEPVFRSMQSGGRSGRVDQWDVEIVARPLMAMTPSGTPVPVSPLIVQHFNEAYASEEMPHGAPIGRTKTGTYATVQHRTALQPFIDHCEAAGLPYTAWGANRGQDAYVDIMLAENGTREEVIANLKALSNAAGAGDGSGGLGGAFSMSGLRDNADAVIRFGIQIHHTFDGAFTVRGIAERVACLNGMVATKAEDLLTLQHKKGVMDHINWSGLAPLLTETALRLFAEMQNVVRMNTLPLATEDWEALLVLAEERGILSWPSLGQNNQLTGGRVFRAAAQGWQDPSLPWVAVGGNDGDTAGSLNHAYNVFTGIVTHQVAAHDAYGRVTGGKAISVSRTQDMLQRVHMLMREVQDDAEAAAAAAGADDVGAWIFNNGIPMLNNVAHEDADEGHILPRITLNAGQDNERTKQLLSVIPTA